MNSNLLRGAVWCLACLVVCAVVCDGYTMRIGMERDHLLPDEAIASGAVAHGWVRGERAAAARELSFTFAVSLKNMEALEKRLLEVSDPAHAAYGSHWSLETVTRETVDLARTEAVVEWLAETLPGAVQQIMAGGAWVQVSGVTVEEAETVFGAEFWVYAHAGSGVSVVRSRVGYSLPAHVAAAVDFVGGMLRLPNTPASDVATSSVPGDGLVVDPHLIRKYYEVEDTVGTGNGSTQAVAQFLGQYAHEFDLDEFRLLFAPLSKGVRPTYVGPDTGLSGTEASLDLEYIVGIGAQIPTTFWSTGGLHDNQEPFLEWMVNVSALATPPNVFSVSYGDVESSLSTSYMSRVSAEFAKIGIRGVSVLFASGDSGVGCANGVFSPNFPASSPWVTTVGGTALGLLESEPEMCNGLSGGGFSNFFDAPDYQAQAVASYLSKNTKNLPPSKFYNVTGRAYPDVSALSSGFVIVIDGVTMPGVAGTSCASPTTAGVFSLANNLRMAQGHPPLGFLNVAIYSKLLGTPAFFDVTKGGNPPQGGGCDGECFFAAPGWDPCSGSGAPRFKGIMTALS